MPAYYRIIWPHSISKGDLASALREAESLGQKQLVLDAISEATSLLHASPQTAGESRGSEQRILVIPPIAIQFEVHENSEIVLIVAFRHSLRSTPDGDAPSSDSLN